MMKQRNYSPWSQWMTKLATTTHEDPLSREALEDFDSWADRRQARLVELLGPLPDWVPAEPEVVASIQADGYRQEKLVFDSEDTMSVPCYLLVPDGRAQPGPAVLAIHGHGPGKSQVCGLEVGGPPNGDYAAQLARRGYIVLAPDLRCFGERADATPPDHYTCDTNLVHAVMAGCNPLTQNLWDLSCALDVLADHPLVDAERMAVAGLSYGGTLALFLAAWDRRVAAAVVSGYFSSWAASHRIPWNMCGSQVLPGMLGRLEHVDLGALIAPRPLLVETGTEDMIFPVEAARASVARLRTVYERFDAGDRLVHDVFEGEHQWHGDAAYGFLDRWLSA